MKINAAGFRSKSSKLWMSFRSFVHSTGFLIECSHFPTNEALLFKSRQEAEKFLELIQPQQNDIDDIEIINIQMEWK